MRRAFAYIAVLLCVAAFHCEAGAASQYILNMERTALPEVRAPEVRVLDLSNGMRCYLLSDTALPIVKAEVITRIGGIYDQADKVGLAALAAAHMRTGGAGSLSPEDFDKRLDDLGASLDASSGREMSVAVLNVLSEDLEEGMGLMFDMLFRPKFDEKRLATARKNMEEAILRSDDSPDEQASRIFREMIYGKKSPWARRPDKRSLGRIGAKDIADFHGRYFKSNNMILAVAGDFSYGKMKELLERLAANTPAGDVALPQVEPVELRFAEKREDVKKRTSQSFIRMGHLGIRRDNPDKFALTLLDDVLGGSGFKSRLMDDIRVKRGMAYSIYSNMTADKDYGTFVVSMDTKANQAEKAIELVREHIRRIADEGDFTREEIDFSKRSMLARLVFLFDQPFGVVSQRARYHFFGYPDDYWRVYRDGIMRADERELKRVAKEYLHPDGLGVVVVGPAGAAKGKGAKKR